MVGDGGGGGIYPPDWLTTTITSVKSNIAEISRDGRIKKYTNKSGRDRTDKTYPTSYFQATGFYDKLSSSGGLEGVPLSG